jgi:hypothetical protein
VLRARTSDHSGAWYTIIRHANGRVTVKDEAQACGRPLSWFCRTAKALATELGNAKSLAIRRDMGIGDLLLLTPTLRELHSRYPDLAVDFFCCDQFRCLFEGNDDVFTLYPLERWDELSPDYSLRADLLGWAERSPVRDCLDRSSIFAKAFDLVLDDGFPRYHVFPEEDAAAVAFLQQFPKPWVALAPLAV